MGIFPLYVGKSLMTFYCWKKKKSKKKEPPFFLSIENNQSLFIN